LFIPASSSCSAGNVDTAFSVCRTCHTSPPKNGAPVPFLTYGDVSNADIKPKITAKLSADAMPPPNSGLTISSQDKSRILAWLSAGAVGVPYANGICP